MSEMKHTPLPWILRKGTTAGAEVVAKKPRGGEYILARFAGKDRLENAALFLAAPDLASVVERLIQWDSDFPVNCHNGYAGLVELNRIIASGRAAIAKATASEAK